MLEQNMAHITYLEQLSFELHLVTHIPRDSSIALNLQLFIRKSENKVNLTFSKNNVKFLQHIKICHLYRLLAYECYCKTVYNEI